MGVSPLAVLDRRGTAGGCLALRLRCGCTPASDHHCPAAARRLAFFGLFPVVLGIGLTWLYAYVFTVAGVYDNASPETQARRALCFGR